jgi:hypothetical protein
MRSAIITINFSLIDDMFKNKYFSNDCETIWKDKLIYFVPEHNILNRDFAITGSESSTVSVPSTAKLLY